jgi:phospholipid/cholesterol/gamma-HCH transport system substrate-binding protein
MEKVNKGEGSLGQLANNDSLYNNLNSTARNLDLLLSDFRQHPGRYVKFSVISFGGKGK